jgi:hypothetical protein
MKKYFFDIVDGDGSAFDYRGRDFPSPEAAYPFAELLALDLATSDSISKKCAVSVSDARGKQYFVVPVHPEPEEDVLINPDGADRPPSRLR